MTSQVNSFVSAFYDSVVYLGLCINRTIEDGDDLSDGLKVAQKLWNNTFPGDVITGAGHHISFVPMKKSTIYSSDVIVTSGEVITRAGHHIYFDPIKKFGYLQYNDVCAVDDD